MRLSLRLAPTLLALTAIAANAAPITVSSGTIQSLAQESPSPLQQTLGFAAGLPSYETVTAMSGASVLTTTRDWQLGADGTATLGFAFDHVRGGTFGSFTDATASRIRFTALETAYYSLTGFFALDGSERIEFDVALVNLTTGATLFANEQISDNTSDQRFALGEMAGDVSNALVGSLSGMLTVGHEYGLSYRSLLNTRVDDSGARGVGALSLAIGATPVAAPSTLFLLCLGLASVAAGRWCVRPCGVCEPEAAITPTP